MTRTASLTLHALPDFPLVRPGEDLAALLIARLTDPGPTPEPGDVLVLAQKIVSKAESRMVDLATVTPSQQAVTLGAETGKDPRLVETILRESVRVVRHRPNLLIMEHRLGFVMANAGVDHSNLATPGGPDQVLLLPEDPDASAARIRARLSAQFGIPLAVVITDSFGRPFRRGSAGVAIGAAGLPSLVDLRGTPDLFGRTLEVTLVGLADEIAAAASLLQGQGAEGQPAVLLRGLRWSAPDAPAAALIRLPAEDLFR